MALEEQMKEKLRTLTVEVLLELRSAYLRTYGSTVMLTHWEQIANRVRSATRTTSSTEEWVTDLTRSLRLSASGSSLSSATVDLAAYVHERGCAVEWLDLLDREWGYVISLTRLAAEQRAEDKKAARQAPEGTA